MAGVRRGETRKGEVIAELIEQGLTNNEILAEMQRRDRPVGLKYVEEIRRKLADYGVWNYKEQKPDTGASDDAPHQISQAQIEHIYKLSDQGLNNTTIAKRLGVSIKTVQRELRARPRVFDLTEGTINAKVADMVRKGCTLAEIRRVLHVNNYRIAQVKKYMREQGEKLPENRAGRKPKETQAIEEEIESLAQMLTWAGAFRKLAEYCKRRGYDDAVNVAKALAKAKGMRL